MTAALRFLSFRVLASMNSRDEFPRQLLLHGCVLRECDVQTPAPRAPICAEQKQDAFVLARRLNDGLFYQLLRFELGIENIRSHRAIFGRGRESRREQQEEESDHGRELDRMDAATLDAKNPRLRCYSLSEGRIRQRALLRVASPISIVNRIGRYLHT
jgi:hypothetical protein